MKMDKVAGSGKDEFYTPPYAVEPILKYVPSGTKVLCPFDTEESHFVKMLRAKGCVVGLCHLETGTDFFDLPNSCGADFVVSNPPYSVKGDVLERLFKWGTPFAMLVGVVGLFESQKRFDMFRTNEFEIMYLNRRVAYFENYKDQKPSLNPPFSSVYVTHKMLPRQIMFEEIKK